MDPSDERELEKLRRDKRKAEKKDNLKDVAELCNCIGEILSKYGKWEEAIAEHETELALSEAFDDKIGCAVACRKIGECFCGLEQYDKALELQERHLVLARSCDNMLEEQRALATIGRTYLFQTESEREKSRVAAASRQAENSFVQSLELCEKLKSKVSNIEFIEMKTRLILNLGLVYDGRGEVKQCAELMKKAITLAEKHKLYSDLYRCQYSLASMYQRSANPSQALRQLEEAQKCAQKLRDKHLESDALTLKSQIYIELGDMGNGKHCMKKAHKFGSSLAGEAERIKKYFRSAVKIEAALTELDLITDELNKQVKLEEKVADAAVDLGLYKLAIKYYSKMFTSAQALGASKNELIPIFVSLAQTYADDKQFAKAMEFYKKELDCREDEPEQECKTWMNIAEIVESDGKTYNTISEAYLKAFDCARRGKLRKLQVHVLKSLIAVQKRYKQNGHLQQTSSKLQQLKDKYHIGSDDEMSEEESQPQEEEEDGDLSLSDLTESEHSEDENVNTGPTVTVGRSRGRQIRAKRNEKGETPLHKACIEGNVNQVKKLIGQGHQINPRDYCGWLPLHEAANHEHYEIVELLLSNGALINDRGGQHCGGVTPLIDAASCGNLQIVELLLSKGANPLAKDDEGQTALDCLLAWRERTAETLSQEVLVKCMSVERLLCGRLQDQSKVSKQQHTDRTQVGSQCSSMSNSSQSVPNSGRMPELKAPRNSKRRSGPTASRRRRLPSSGSDDGLCETGNRRRRLSSDSDECHSETGRRNPSSIIDNYSSDSEDDIAVHTNPELDSIISQPASATEIYRSAMDRVGSACRQSVNYSQSATQASKSDNGHQALINEYDCITDDWLIDDMQPSKRRRVDVNGLFSTSNTRHSSERRHSKEETSRHERVSGVRDREVIESFNEDGTDDKRQDRSTVLGSDDELSVNMFEEDFVMIDDSIPDKSHKRTSISNHGPSKTNCRKKQTKITNFSTDKNRQIERTSGLSTPIFNPTQTLHSVNNSQLPEFPSQQINQTSNLAVMRIKVKVKDKLLLIPVTNSDNSKLISWLAKETAQRYYSLCGLRPMLTLRTKDGAFLSPDDPITLVLSSNEEIDASVDSWDLPPLIERYSQACRTFNTVQYRNIRTLLQSCDQNGKLEMCNLALRSCHIHPILRALQCQNRLTHINLKGNRLGDNGMESLCKVLGTLPNLSSLNLSGNELSAFGVQSLSDELSTTTPKPLQNLTNLDLSWNSLGDKSTLPVTGLVCHLTALTQLSVAACGLTAQFFQQHRLPLADAFRDCRIQCLNVSYNKFGDLGIELLLRSLNHRQITSLDLSATHTSLSAQHMLHYLHNYIKQESCGLQKLSLAECHLTSEHSDAIISIPEIAPQLRHLNLSKNPKLDNSVVCSLLEASVSTESMLDSLLVDGCGIKSPLTSDFLDSVSDKLTSGVALRYLSFTCQGLDKVDVDSIKQVWMDHWTNLGCADVQEETIRLYVNENM